MSTCELLWLHSQEMNDEICQCNGAANMKTKAFHAKC